MSAHLRRLVTVEAQRHAAAQRRADERIGDYVAAVDAALASGASVADVRGWLVMLDSTVGPVPSAVMQLLDG